MLLIVELVVADVVVDVVVVAALVGAVALSAVAPRPSVAPRQQTLPSRVDERHHRVELVVA